MRLMSSFASYVQGPLVSLSRALFGIRVDITPRLAASVSAPVFLQFMLPADNAVVSGSDVPTPNAGVSSPGTGKCLPYLS